MVMNMKKIVFKIIPMILMPILFFLSFICIHSDTIIKNPYPIYFSFIVLLDFYIIDKLFIKTKIKLKFICKLFFALYYISVVILLLFIYHSTEFKTWLITTSKGTTNHKYIADIFYNKKEIKFILNNNSITEPNETFNPDLIEVKAKKSKKDYEIKTFKFKGKKAYIAYIYNPSRLRVATSLLIGYKGEYATDIAEENKAKLAINGGGFKDYMYDDGGIPSGITMSYGSIVYNDNTKKSFIGLSEDNKLVLIKNASVSDVKNNKIRDGVSMGPFLIVNGKKAKVTGNGGKGYAARTAIGQRKDGTIILVVLDSNYSRTKGASIKDLVSIMAKNKAVNAANLDGGTSSVIILPKKEAKKYKKCNNNYCYINDPVTYKFEHMTRKIPTIFYLK